MARKVQIILTDDLTNEESVDISTVTFGIDGTHYEIDLTAKNAEALRDEFSRYVQAARKVKAATARATNRQSVSSPRPAAESDGIDPKVLRAWAEDKGLLQPGSKGRISGEIKDKYVAEIGTGAMKDKSKAKAATTAS